MKVSELKGLLDWFDQDAVLVFLDSKSGSLVEVSAAHNLGKKPKEYIAEVEEVDKPNRGKSKKFIKKSSNLVELK